MSSPKSLRLWPGIVAVALQWLSRFGIKALIPGINGFGKAVMGTLILTIVLIVWWAFFSRARRNERFGGLALIGAVMGLIQVMENLSDPAKLGAGIAVAFVATIYGVGSANLIFIPISTKLMANISRMVTMRSLIASTSGFCASSGL